MEQTFNAFAAPWDSEVMFIKKSLWSMWPGIRSAPAGSADKVICLIWPSDCKFGVIDMQRLRFAHRREMASGSTGSTRLTPLLIIG